jgi:hypothetical protein
MARDIIHGFYHKCLDEEIKRLLMDCKEIGININIKEATALIAEKSKRGFMPKSDILDYLAKVRYKK